MELLVQMWCPFEDSPMDRALYVWGCARSGCQRKDGSVRAWRGLRYNAVYAAKLEKKKEKEERRLKAIEEKAMLNATRIAEQSGGTRANPFSMTKSLRVNPFAFSSNPKQDASPFGRDTSSLGAQIFGAGKANPVTSEDKSVSSTTVNEPSEIQDEESQDMGQEVGDEDSDSDAASLIEALASTAISESQWKEAPLYAPIYLSTVSEYVPPQPKEKVPKGVKVDDADLDDMGKKKKSKDMDLNWIKETYENSMEVDQVFERFMKRVEWESEQCIRYELKGTPLPFATDKTFDLLWYSPPEDPLPVTKAVFKVTTTQKRMFNPSAVAPCSQCGAARVFECQLMPNLINILQVNPVGGKSEGEEKITDEERRKEVEKVLKGGGDLTEKRGMEWGTCMIFSCGQDCSISGLKGEKDVWREEIVYVQWDV
ncbi:programmed cell death protein 2 [Crepidotus variabilis]|uniref:Programmed cell death protein 2 n=1 Tax=Crepidotus variabilis TaxID=179855 RepID=A0A9P6E561_9AGAR|nr:programmed cell death protein 2 [Crepidotus variabilis]